MSEPKQLSAMVAEFHRTFSVPVKTLPELPKKFLCLSDSYKIAYREITGALAECPDAAPDNRRQLRVSLLLEEVREYIEAELANDLVGIADALADMAYIIHGTAHEYGIPLDEVSGEVHRSNMSKVGPDGKAEVRPDGKILKGPGFTRPDIAGILARAIEK